MINKSNFEIFLGEYTQAVFALESGLFEKASETVRKWRELIDASTDKIHFLDDLRRLLSIRLALKSGQAQEGVEQLLEQLSTKDNFILAEAHFVRGLSYFQAEQPLLGVCEFDKAWPLYAAAEKKEKSLLSRYNSYVGSVNAGTIDHLDQYEILAELEREALKIKSDKILAWVLRQKSYLSQFEGRFAGALSLIVEAAHIFRMNGPQSDYQLAVLQAADCYLDLGKPLEAQMEVEKLSLNVDARVEFARDFILERLGIKKKINIQCYSVQPTYWKNKWLKNQSQQVVEQAIPWNIATGEFMLGSVVFNIRHNSREGSLLRILMNAKRSKATICEMLWPEDADSMILDNRLHKLISRINKKIELIGHKDGFYFLKRSILAS